MNDHGESLGGFRDRPITEVGRIVQNGFLDETLVDIIKKNTKQNNALYPGSTENKVFTILPREICLENIDPTIPKQNDAPYVLSVANGAFKKNESLSEVSEKLVFRGLGGGQGARYTDGENPENQLALVIGGSQTMRNTGPKRINNGDLVMWQVPDPRDPFERGVPHSDRMPWQTVPFDPLLDLLTKQSLVRHLTQNPVMTSSEQKFKMPLQEGADKLKQSILQIGLEMVHVLLSSGLIVFDKSALDPSKSRKRKNNASEYQNPDTRKDILKSLSEHFGLREFSLREKDKFKFKLNPTDKKEVTLVEGMMSVLIAQTQNSLMLPMKGKTLTDNDQGKLLRNQNGLLENLFSAISSTNYSVTRRIIGTANTPAEPGRPFDILLGSKV